MKISILMATYNGEKYIYEQIESILSQTFQNFELIISDDCSKDNTYLILEEFAKKDKRISLFKNGENLGYFKNFEKLLSYATGDYIAFSDQDDIWTKTHLDVLLNTIGSCDLAGGNSELIDGNGQSLHITMKDVLHIKDVPQTNRDAIKVHLFYRNFIQGSACLFTKHLLQESLPFPNTNRFHDLWLAVNAAYLNGIAYTSDIVLLYRQHTTNVPSNNKWNFFNNIKDSFKNGNQSHSSEQIEFLESLKIANAVRFSEFIFTDALKYYYNLYNHKRLYVLHYLTKNFYAMYFSHSPILFVSCLFKKLFLR